MYSLRYGTPPVVHQTGGLADTVSHATEQTILEGSGNGFVFEDQHPDALVNAIVEALALRSRQKLWKQLVNNAMQEENDWSGSARQYLELYKQYQP
jgi:starch synthase